MGMRYEKADKPLVLTVKDKNGVGQEKFGSSTRQVEFA
jgi:hypothetical protein